LHFASPEVIISIFLQKPDCFLDYHKSDVFSVGLVFLAVALLEDLSLEKIN
jgi:serine/threonine protein kinase